MYALESRKETYVGRRRDSGTEIYEYGFDLLQSFGGEGLLGSSGGGERTEGSELGGEVGLLLDVLI